MFVPLCQRNIVNLGMVFIMFHRSNLVETILQLCKEKNISVNKLAKLSGVAQSTIDSILKGKSKYPQASTSDKIAAGCGFSQSEFFAIVDAKLFSFPPECCTYAERVRQLRESRGLSMEEMSDELGIPEEDYEQLESPVVAAVFLKGLIALADYFDVSLDYLAGRSDVPERR